MLLHLPVLMNCIIKVSRVSNGMAFDFYLCVSSFPTMLILFVNYSALIQEYTVIILKLRPNPNQFFSPSIVVSRTES